MEELTISSCLNSQCWQLVREAQLCGLEFLDAILSQYWDLSKYSSGVEKILDAASHLLTIQKELGLNYGTGFSSVVLSLFSILTQSELEHEQYSILKLVLFLLRWKDEKGTLSFATVYLWSFLHSMVVENIHLNRISG